jgi:hypothetical protein
MDREAKRRETQQAAHIYQLMETSNPGFPTRLLRECQRLPAGYQEIFRKALFRVVPYLDYLDTGTAKEATIRQWAVTYREQIGKPEWLFPPGVSPEFLNDARELARLVAAIDIGNEQGDRAMLYALGGADNPSFEPLRAAIGRREGAPKGGLSKAAKYKQYVPEWQSDWNRVEVEHPNLRSRKRKAHFVVKCHEERYKSSDDPEAIKTVDPRTILNHLFPR